MPKFYYSPGACSLAVHIVLEETGAPYELDLRRARSADGVGSEKYREINFKARVPALEGVRGSAGSPGVLTEAAAILVLLARRHPEARLIPPDPDGEARCLEWLSWIASDLHACGFGALWRPDRFVDDAALHAEVERRARSNIRARFDEIEAIFADGRDWSVAGAFSVVDAYLLVFWRWGIRIGFSMIDWPDWSEVMRRVRDRPSVQRALAGGHI